MAQVKVYDPEGNEYLKESIDARECIAQCGYTLTPPKSKSVVTGEEFQSVAPVVPVAPPAPVPEVAPVVPPAPAVKEASKPWVK